MENGVPFYWTYDQDGDLDVDDIPEAIQRLNISHALIDNCSSVDVTAFGSQEWWRNDENPNHNNRHQHVRVNRGDVVSVTNLLLKQFWSTLIENFDSQYKQSMFVWPKWLVSKPQHVTNSYCLRSSTHTLLQATPLLA